MAQAERPAVKFRPSAELDTYRVLLDGEDIGEVRKWERRYNLRRVIVSRGWRARTASGEALYGRDGSTAETRRDAAQALVRKVEDARAR